MPSPAYSLSSKLQLARFWPLNWSSGGLHCNAYQMLSICKFSVEAPHSHTMIVCLVDMPAGVAVWIYDANALPYVPKVAA